MPPLFTFSLVNNLPMCHCTIIRTILRHFAILTSTQFPNFYSVVTVMAKWCSLCGFLQLVVQFFETIAGDSSMKEFDRFTGAGYDITHRQFDFITDVLSVAGRTVRWGRWEPFLASGGVAGGTGRFSYLNAGGPRSRIIRGHVCVEWPISCSSNFREEVCVLDGERCKLVSGHWLMTR